MNPNHSERLTLSPPGDDWTKAQLIDYIAATLGTRKPTATPKPALLAIAGSAHRLALNPVEAAFIEAVKAAFNGEDAPSPDLPVPTGNGVHKGWRVNPYCAARSEGGAVQPAWSTVNRHDDGTYTEGARYRSDQRDGIPLYSTREKALAAARFYAVRAAVEAFLAFLPPRDPAVLR